MKKVPDVLKSLHCCTCRWTDCVVREVTAAEVALIGYEPADRRVCTECCTLSESIIEIEVDEFGKAVSA